MDRFVGTQLGKQLALFEDALFDNMSRSEGAMHYSIQATNGIAHIIQMLANYNGVAEVEAHFHQSFTEAYHRNRTAHNSSLGHPLGVLFAQMERELYTSTSCGFTASNNVLERMHQLSDIYYNLSHVQGLHYMCNDFCKAQRQTRNAFNLIPDVDWEP